MAYIDTYIPALVPRQKVCMYVSLKDCLLTYIPHVSRPLLRYIHTCPGPEAEGMYVSLQDSLLTYIPHVSRPVLGMYVCLYVCFSRIPY